MLPPAVAGPFVPAWADRRPWLKWRPPRYLLSFPARRMMEFVRIPSAVPEALSYATTQPVGARASGTVALSSA